MIVTKSKYRHTIFAAQLLLISVVLYIIVGTVYAGLASGYAWGGGASNNEVGVYEGMGWIDMSGVSIPSTDGPLSGYAWSGGAGEPGGYGWISFEGSDVADCVPPLAPAARVGDTIVGGASILAIKDELAGNRGGYDGCIVLDGVTVNADGTLDGYAWSSDLGWIDMDAVGVVGCTDSIPSNASRWDAEEEEGLGTSVQWTYGASDDDATKCQFKCDDGYAWNSGSCELAYPNLLPLMGAPAGNGGDPITGVYSSVSATFATKNNGNAPAGAFKNSFQFDGADVHVQNVTSLDPGTTGSVGITLGNDVPFGTYTYGVKVDYLNTVTPESDETDNDLSTTVTLLPPTPPMVLLATPNLVRTGETSTLEWKTIATYPMGCKITGPGGFSKSFNPSVEGAEGTVETNAITAKFAYTLSCTEPITGTTFDSVTAIVGVTGEIEER